MTQQSQVLTTPEDHILNENIHSSVTKSYLDYSMSVIIGRALPDVRDGLKPVHRRILYAMHELGMTSKSPYKKSARIVGDVIGKYHPHGDSAVYEALVRMAQDFSMRCELIDGQGNFGSIDGDNAAAMRYTEARLTSVAEDLLKDLEKDTVEFRSNYDNTLQEPTVLPTRVPNLLVNGTNGIAVGMATSIPPHNLFEVTQALIYLLQNPSASVSELMQFIQGPDFPTGGTIFGRKGIIDAYTTGKGRVKVRAKTRIEIQKGRSFIIIDELPYQVNKAKLVEQISELAKEKAIEGISEVRDESSRTGMRVVIEVKKDAHPEIVLNHLYKSTSMETTFGIIFLAIHNQKPQVFNLLELLKHFLSHRKTVVIRRTIFDLDSAKSKYHLITGLVKALQKIDETIEIIKKSETSQQAKEKLMTLLQIDQLQASAIMDMRLHRLTGLEKSKLLKEQQELLEKIKDLSQILGSEEMLRQTIIQELQEVQAKHSSPRRTNIEEDYEAIEIEDLIPNEKVVVTMSHRGYVKRVPLNVYERQHRGGKGKMSGNTHEDDFIESFFIANAHDTILFITNKGRLYWLKVYKIPDTSRTAIGKAVVNLVDVQQDEKIMSIMTTTDFQPDKSLVFFTRRGVVKRTNLSEYSHIRSIGVRAINLDEGDEVVTTKIVDQTITQLVITTYNGMSIRFNLTDVREMGRVSRGVTGIRFKANEDYVIGACAVSNDLNKLLTVSEQGIGKQTEAGSYRLQSRGGKGVIGMKLTPKTGKLVSIVNVDDENLDLMVLTSSGKMIRVATASIREAGRNTSGVKIVDVGKEKVVYAVPCPREETLQEEESGE